MGNKNLYKSYPYPDNLLVYAHLDELLPLSEDQKKGLEYVISRMSQKRAKVLKLYFENNMTQEEVGKMFGVRVSRAGFIIRDATSLLRREENRSCIRDGYSTYMLSLHERKEKIEQRQEYLKNHPEELSIYEAGFVKTAERAFIEKAGLQNVSDVVELLQNKNYYKEFQGYGPVTDQRVRKRLEELGVKC